MSDKTTLADDLLRYLGDDQALNLSDLIENDIDDDEPKLYHTSSYHTLENLPNYLNKQNDNFKILSINIQSLSAKFDSLKVYKPHYRNSASRSMLYVSKKHG